MSKAHNNNSTMNFVLVNPQHVNVSNPVTKETIMFKQEEINMTTFFTEKSCNLLLATMQNKEDISLDT